MSEAAFNSIVVENTLKAIGLQAGIVIADGIQVKPSTEALISAIQELCSARAEQDFPSAELKKSVRDLLRAGGFKPAGRNKPASEYLAATAKKGTFPIINNLVDINNLISLQTGLPISMLDLANFRQGMTIRHGREDEAYVFNRTGQEIKLKGLIVCCSSENDTALGNPVKDSMTGKIQEDCQGIIAVIYKPASLEIFAESDSANGLQTALDQMANWLKAEAAAQEVRTLIL